MLSHEEIFKQLDFMAQMIPSTLYWIGLDGRTLGVNENALKAIGAPNKEYVIGKTLYEIYHNAEIADYLQKDIYKTIKTGKKSQREEKIIDITTGKLRYYMATRTALRDENGKIIGIIGTSIETTAEKEAEQQRLENERLKLENERYGAIAQDREKGMKLADELFRHQQAEIAKHLRTDIGDIVYEKILLTLRELQVLYAVYRERDAKSAALFLSKMTGDVDNQAAVNAVLNKHLYPKFNVNNQNKLIEKALLLKMIPLFFPTKDEAKKAKK